MRKYPCPRHYEGQCSYGGNKHYDYGFVSGTSSYCRFARKWLSALEKCPLDLD